MLRLDTDGIEVPGANYCIVPRHLAPVLVDALRDQFEPDGVHVVVEERVRDRRRRARRQRRIRRGLAAPPQERRRINHAGGRRVAERRAETTPGRVAILDGASQAERLSVRFVAHVARHPQQVEDIQAARLVVRFQAGDEAGAFGELYRKYRGRLYTFALAALDDMHEAEDVCQEVFAKVEHALPAFELRESPFRAWLFKIARNCILDRHRRAGRFELLDPAALAEIADLTGLRSETGTLEWISQPEISALVDQLPRNQREVIVLRYLFDCSHAESAQLLGRSEAAVRRSHHLALRFLERNLRARSDRGFRRLDHAMRAQQFPRRLVVASFSPRAAA